MAATAKAMKNGRGDQNQGTGIPFEKRPLHKSAGNELQNLDRVEARKEVIGHDAVSRNRVFQR